MGARGEDTVGRQRSLRATQAGPHEEGSQETRRADLPLSACWSVGVQCWLGNARGGALSPKRVMLLNPFSLRSQGSR